MEDKEFKPLSQASANEIDNKLSNTTLGQQNIYENLNQYFNKQDHQQKTLLKARELLGEDGKDLTDEEAYNLYTEIQFLTDSWAEEFERGIFNGKTLEEILKLDS